MKRLPLSHLSMRKRLPLLISSLLLLVMLIFGYMSYYSAKRAALKVGKERLQSLTLQLSTMYANTPKTQIASTLAAAKHEAVKKFLLSNGKDSVAGATDALKKLRQDTLFVLAQLVNKEHTTVLHSAKNGLVLNIPMDSILSSSLSLRSDSGMVGKFYAINNSVFYPVVATVTENNEIIGYLIRWRMMNATQQSLEQLSKLLGSEAKLYIGNRDGILWTDLMKPVAGPPELPKDTDELISHSRIYGDPVIAAVRPVPGTEWLLSVELSQKKVLETVNHFLYWMIFAGGILLVFGFVVAWLMSGTITQPLNQLTKGLTSVSSGNYSLLVQINRYDELGKLARAFNAMSAQVKNSEEALEERAKKYKLLFDKNPLPMWIMSKTSLSILEVNDAAVDHYGYSKQEFLTLSSKDLRPREEQEKYIDYVAGNRSGTEKAGVWKHKRKDGSLVMMDIIIDNIIYKDEPALLVLANDVTEKLKAEAELVRQRISQQKLIADTRIRVQEKEREEIGKELHDNIQQLLATSKLYLGMIKKDSGSNEFLNTSLAYIDNAIHEIRKLSKSLVAPTLNKSTLPGTINELIGTVSAATSLSIELLTKNYQDELIGHDIKLMLYRIVQEQLNNILKHANAQKVQIRLSMSNNNILLTIQDDGKGFDTSKTPNGIGLRNIMTRAEFFDGSVQIISAPGIGCSLELRVPLTAAEVA